MGYKLSCKALLGAVAFALALVQGASAQSAYERFTTDVTSFEFGEPFDVPKDITVTLIACGNIAEGCQTSALAAAEAAQKLGWKTNVIDGRLDPAVWNQAVQRAVADGSDGIITFAITPALIQGGLDAANEAGVPIIAAYQPIFEGVPEVDGYVTLDLLGAGEAGAQFLTEDSGGDGVVLILDTPQFPELMLQNDTMAQNLTEMCPGCTVIRQEFNAALASQRLPTQVASLVAANPEIEYIAIPYDPIGPYVSQGLRQAGQADNVRILAFGGNSIGIDLMRNGEIYANIGAPLNFVGWLTFDLLARNLAGVAETNKIVVPYRVFAPGDALPETFWEPEFDYRQEMTSLWQ